jgi:hypothetical protein
MRKILLVLAVFILAGCSSVSAIRDSGVTLPPGGDVVVACATCAPCATAAPTAVPSPVPTPTLGPSGGRDHLVPATVDRVDGAGNYSEVEPGDRLFISPRTTKLTLRRIHGTAAQPIIVVNHGGQVIIEDEDWVGIDVVDCQYLRLTGTGSGNEYGFVVRDPTNCGVFIRAGSEHIEIDHIEVGPSGGAGIRAHSFYSDVPDGWVMEDIHIHDCYIHNTRVEGMYLGNYQDMHPASDGLDVHDNILRSIDLEGIQVKNFANVRIYHNDLRDIGMRYSPGQGRSGIDLQHDHGSEGVVYDNYIENARRGIELNGAGPTEIYGNVIVGCGFRPDGGGGIRWFYESGMDIHDNEIRDCNEYGVKVSLTRTGTIHDNVICGTVGEHIVNDSATESGNVETESCE